MATTTRRTVLRTAALVTTALAVPFVRGAHAAGKLAVGFWDHWVPGANAPLEKLCQEWGEKEKIDIKVDFITSNGDKDLLTAAAEAQSRSGHDILGMLAWYAPGYADSLEPVDDVMAAADPAARRGQRRRRIPRQAGRALGRGADRGRQHGLAALRADRPDEGVLRARRHQDVSGRRAARQGADGFLELGLFHAGGGEMLQGRLCVRDADELVQRRDADGPARCSTASARSWSTPRATSPPTATRSRPRWNGRKRRCRSFPPSVFAWDDSSNNKALISGQSALIFNAPSAWAVAKRDAPKVAEQLWTFPPPKGPKGRHLSGRYRYWGIWKFSAEQGGGEEPAALPVVARLDGEADGGEPGF